MNWTLTWEKLLKPVVNPGALSSKEEAKLEKEYHYIYTLKKQEIDVVVAPRAPEESKAGSSY